MGNQKGVTEAIKPIHNFNQTLNPNSNTYQPESTGLSFQPYSQGNKPLMDPSEEFSFTADTETLQPMSQGTY